jgi:ankyrin repeat protein
LTHRCSSCASQHLPFLLHHALLFCVCRAQDALGITALSHAASNGSPHAVAALLRAGASVDLVQHSGASPLTCACIGLDDDSLSAPPAAGCFECIRLLLQRRADPDIQNTEPEEAGATALMYASQAGATKAVQLLLACGARTDLTTRDGMSALSLAKRAGQDQVVALLKKKK